MDVNVIIIIIMVSLVGACRSPCPLARYRHSLKIVSRAMPHDPEVSRFKFFKLTRLRAIEGFLVSFLTEAPKTRLYKESLFFVQLRRDFTFKGNFNSKLGVKIFYVKQYKVGHSSRDVVRSDVSNYLFFFVFLEIYFRAKYVTREPDRMLLGLLQRNFNLGLARILNVEH